MKKGQKWSQKVHKTLTKELGVESVRKKAKEEKIKPLKQKWTTALSPVTCKRTDITKLMTDTNNLEIVKTELTQLDILCEQFEYTHNLYLEELDSPEDKKENEIFEYRKQVANWITSCWEQISNHIDGLSDTSKRSLVMYFALFQLFSISSPERKGQGRRINGRTFHVTRKT